MILQERKTMILLLGNGLGISILSFPAFGFFQYMNVHGVSIYIGSSCGLAVLTAMFFWKHVARKRLLIAYPLALLSAYVPVVVSWGIALHPLYWPRESIASDLWRWTQHATVVGGALTSAYWLPASIINCVVLRRGVTQA